VRTMLRPLLLSCLVLGACTQTPAPSPQANAEPAITPVAPPAAPEVRGPAVGDTLPATPATPVPPTTTRADANAAVAASSAASPATAATPLPTVLMHKSPSCGCCGKWADHLRAAGFRVEVRDHDDMLAVKQRLGVPMDQASCHTAEVGGYFVEGHVPAQDIKRLLAEKPTARGISVPGMPAGSPGMEVPDGTVQPYTVELVQADGTAVAYARHDAPAQ
jgi:hypothetical protein